MFEFTSEYRLGIRLLDEQHKELFRLANVLFDIVECNRLDMIEVSIMSFIEYTRYHFVSEERIYSEMNMALQDIEEHKVIHQNILGQLESYHEQVQSQNLTNELAVELCAFVRKWIEQHTLGDDFKMVQSM